MAASIRDDRRPDDAGVPHRAAPAPPGSLPGRSGFGIPHEVVWLNTAHQGVLPRIAADAALTAVEWKLDPTRIPDSAFFEVPERLRATLARMLGCPAGEVIVGNSASHGLHILAAGLPLEPGDEVLLVRDDFPATVLPWQSLEARGVRLRFLPRRSGLSAEDIAASLRPRTRVFCVTWVDSFSGHTLDLQTIGRACRQADVHFVVNATQGFGVRPLRVDRLPVDAVTSAGYKWLCGPYGTGFCWISCDLRDRLRSDRRYWLPLALEQGLGDLRRLHDVPLPPDARRYDVFGTASFFNVLAWTAALEYLQEIGIEAITMHNRSLVTALRGVLEAHGCRSGDPLSGDSPDPILPFRPPRGQDAPPVARRLRRSGVHVALREGGLRLSPHVHNDLEDVERFAAALGRALRRP